MNYDSVWQTIRYLLIAAGAFFVGRGWVNDEMWQQIIAAVGTVLPILWGLYTKWGTTPVQDTVIERRSIPVVSSATGQITEAKK